MKKVLIVLLMVAMAMTFISCKEEGNETNDNVVSESNDNNVNEGSNDNESTDSTVETEETEEEETDSTEEVSEEMTLEEILDKMYEASGLEFPATAKSPINAENMVYMLGVDNFDYLQGMASEPMMSSQAHSVVLLKLDPSSDFETIKKDIKENVDGRKWICVGVEEENILVESVSDYVILIMDDNAQVLMDSFLEIMN